MLRVVNQAHLDELSCLFQDGYTMASLADSQGGAQATDSGPNDDNIELESRSHGCLLVLSRLTTFPLTRFESSPCLPVQLYTIR